MCKLFARSWKTRVNKIELKWSISVFFRSRAEVRDWGSCLLGMNTWEGNKEGAGWAGGRKGIAMQDKASVSPVGWSGVSIPNGGRYSQAIMPASWSLEDHINQYSTYKIRCSSFAHTGSPTLSPTSDPYAFGNC